MYGIINMYIYLNYFKTFKTYIHIIIYTIIYFIILYTA